MRVGTPFDASVLDADLRWGTTVIPAGPLATAVPTTLVPDTSVLIDGRISELVDGDHAGARILVPLAALAELEAQANRGMETGFAGLDELSKLQQFVREGKCTVEFAGQRPTSEEVERAATGAIDAVIRDTAVESGGLFVTSDRVQAHTADAQGVEHLYIRPIVDDVPDLTQLQLWSYFDDETMSVHLKSDCRPMAKKGTPGHLAYRPIREAEIGHQELRTVIKECIEFAKRDYQSFVELERKGCTVLQMGPMRVTVAQPPFSDGLEITAVRPVIKTTLEDYDLPPQIRERLEGRARGVFIAGPPGSGKSTFAAAVAEHLHGLERVVKTMEQPRDLQLPKEVTQYGALDRDMQWTGEILLLVRPDHVVYDEVRTTDDYRVFADMRLAGIGLFGVTHANRPIDGVQRLIGRVDLGMIPQVVDTVVFIEDGRIETILELTFTVKVPEGMMVEDLARPVVRVRDVVADKDTHELYTFGEQIVVMPLEEVAGRSAHTGASALAEKELKRALARNVRGRFEVEVQGNKATVYVPDDQVPAVIGKGGATVQGLERKLGIRLDIRSLGDLPPAARGERGAGNPGPAPGGTGGGKMAAKLAPVPPKIKKTGNNVFLHLEPIYGGLPLQVLIEGERVADAMASRDGKLRFKSDSGEAKALLEAKKRGLEVLVRPV